MNVLFFITQSVNEWKTLTTNLDVPFSSIHHQEIAKSMVKEELAARSITYKDHRPAFDAKAVIQVKSLVIIMVPLLAIFVAILSMGLHRYFIEHLVFSIHFYAFFPLYLSIANSLATLPLVAMQIVAVTATHRQSDLVTSSVLFAALSIYLAIAVRTVYRNGRFVSIAKGLVPSYLVTNILYLYRFIRFLITVRST